MKKNFLQDVIPPNQKRSIRDIPIPDGKKAKQEEEPESRRVPRASSELMSDIKISRNTESRQAPPQPPTNEDFDDFEFEQRPKKKPIKLILVILVILAIAGFFILNNPKAEVLVYPKTENIFLQEGYAISDETLNYVEGTLGYSMLKIQKDVNINVEAKGEEEVSEKASGTIKIFNEYSTKPQKLVQRTRFESNKDLVYRIAESVSVPGYTENEGEIIPGEIEVEVFADEVGDKYNIGKTEFTIPGFEDLPQFDTMYAGSVTDMTGGFVGTKKVVSDEDKEEGLETLKQLGADQIVEEINNLSDEFIIVVNEEDIEYSRLTENDVNDGVQLSITASIDAYVFDKKDLAAFLIEKEISGAPEGDAIVTNDQEISFRVVTELEDPEDEDSKLVQKLDIEGDVAIEWLIDPNELASVLEKKKKGEIMSLISEKKEIIKAEFRISPIWRNSFPKASKIEILIQK